LTTLLLNATLRSINFYREVRKKIMLTISNFQLHLNVNTQNGGVTGKNLIYDIHNSDGSVDRVMRVWDVYSRFSEYRHGVKKSVVIEPAPVHMYSVLKNYALTCEKNVGNKKFPNVNIHRCGALLSKTRIKQPPPPQKYVTANQLNAQLSSLNTQIQILQKQVSDLTAKLSVATKEKQALQAQLNEVNAKLTLLLKILQS
jgi:hypothetical protein